ncbi:MAG: DUF748 domain-containing protein [Nitrospira sp.]|nr:DUF748 domain-containing protein [Nitrospira sp.]
MRRFLRLPFLAGLAPGLIGLYALAGFVLLPYLIKAYGVPAAAEYLKHPVVLREASFNPFTLAVRLKGLEVWESDQTPMIGFDELVVDLRATTLLGQRLGFDEIRLTMPFAAAKVNREGKLNLLALVPPSESETGAASAQPSEAKSKKAMPVEIGLLEINKGVVEYRDDSKSRPVSMDIVLIHITLRNFSTIQGSDNAYAFTAEIGKGESLAWEGTVSIEPLESDGKLSLSGIKVGTLYQAVQDRFRVDVQDGEIALSATYHVDVRGSVPQVKVTDGRLLVQHLTLGERGFPEPLVKVPLFEVEGFTFDLGKQAVEIATIRSTDAYVTAWVNPDGTVNLQRLFEPVVGSAMAASPPTSVQEQASDQPSDQPWHVSIGEVELQNYGAAFDDRTLPRPQYVDVEKLNVTVKEIRIPFKQALPVDLSMTLNQTGIVTVKGMVTVEPLGADVAVALKHIGIRPFQAYLDRFLNVDVRDGTINLAGTLRYATVRSKEPLLRFRGDVGIDRLVMSDRKEFEEVLSWKALNVNRLALDVEPTVVKIGEVVLQEPAVQAVLESDGTLNLSHLVVQSQPDGLQGASGEKKGETSAAPSAARSAQPAIMIDQVKVVKAAAVFRDISIEPSVRTGLTELSGTITGLSSKQIKKADVDLTGRVDGAAPLKIAGKINPLSEDAFTDVVVTLGGMDLTPASPYSGKYAGYVLSKGKLSLDLKYKVSQKVLEAENVVLIDQLTFGHKVESPDATSLPVPLLVALLQDRKGLIEIDLPIRGNLDDPDFKYGKVVIATLFNLLGKIAASPFTLLGKLLPGGGGDDLQFIAFAPGSTALTPEEAAKLEALETALVERVGLLLDIKGTFDAVLDREAVRARKLKERLLAMKRQEFGSTEEEKELSPEDEQRLVAKWFAKLLSQQTNQPADPAKAEGQPAPTFEEMTQRLMAEIQVTDAELESLARQRAEVVRNRLVQSGRLGVERVFLTDVGIAEPAHDQVRTQLGLTAGS